MVVLHCCLKNQTSLSVADLVGVLKRWQACAVDGVAGSFGFGDADYAQNVQEDGQAGEWQQSLWVLTQVKQGSKQ